MRICFDNNVPRSLRHRLPSHEVVTAREKGWHELKNGVLLSTAERAGFELFVTGDKNLSYQQNLRKRTIALVVLPTINWKILRQDTSSVLAAVDRATPGSFEALLALAAPLHLPRRDDPKS